MTKEECFLFYIDHRDMHCNPGLYQSRIANNSYIQDGKMCTKATVLVEDRVFAYVAKLRSSRETNPNVFSVNANIYRLRILRETAVAQNINLKIQVSIVIVSVFVPLSCFSLLFVHISLFESTPDLFGVIVSIFEVGFRVDSGT